MLLVTSVSLCLLTKDASSEAFRMLYPFSLGTNQTLYSESDLCHDILELVTLCMLHFAERMILTKKIAHTKGRLLLTLLDVEGSELNSDQYDIVSEDKEVFIHQKLFDANAENDGLQIPMEKKHSTL